MQMSVKKVHPEAKVPDFANPGDAGLDLYTVEEVTLEPGQRAQLKTGIAIAIPDGHVGLVWDKSGISHKFGLKTLGGVVDAGYRGEVMVGMVNLGNIAHSFSKGDKIAQMLIQKVERPDIQEADSLDETIRGEQGFGSSGI